MIRNFIRNYAMHNAFYNTSENVYNCLKIQGGGFNWCR